MFSNDTTASRWHTHRCFHFQHEFFLSFSPFVPWEQHNGAQWQFAGSGKQKDTFLWAIANLQCKVQFGWDIAVSCRLCQKKNFTVIEHSISNTHRLRCSIRGWDVLGFCFKLDAKVIIYWPIQAHWQGFSIEWRYTSAITFTMTALLFVKLQYWVSQYDKKDGGEQQSSSQNIHRAVRLKSIISWKDGKRRCCNM